MSKRNKKTKNEIIQEILEENPDYKIIKRNNTNLKDKSVNKSADLDNNNRIKDEIFFTNLSMAGLNAYKNKQLNYLGYDERELNFKYFFLVFLSLY